MNARSLLRCHGCRARDERRRDDSGMTLFEVLIAATLLIVLMTVVSITMGLFSQVSETVNSQYQEFNQAIPAFAPLQALIRAEVEPAPATASGAPTPGFAAIGNFSLTFYASVGTAYNNVTSGGTTAGPAKIVALEVDKNGNAVTSSTVCSTTSPCSFQVRRYLPIVNPVTGPTCPVTGQPSTNVCQYPANYTLITNTNNVVNNPSNTVTQSGTSVPTQPIFSYSFFDPDWPLNNPGTGTTIALSAYELQVNPQTMSGLSASPYNYPTDTQGINTCNAKSVGGSYQTTAIACPLDAIQSVGIDLMIAAPGSGGANGQVENHSVVYRYSPSGPGGTAYPYKYSSAVG